MKTKIVKSDPRQLTADLSSQRHDYTDLPAVLPRCRRVTPIRPDGRKVGLDIRAIREIRGMALKSFCPPIFLACLLSLFPAIVFSEDAGQPPLDNESRFQATANRLNLTAEQQEKINALRRNQRQQMNALFQELQATRQQVQAGLNNPSTTRESIAPLVAELKAIQAKIVDLRINNIFTIKEMLHSDQLSKLQQFRQQRNGAEKGGRPFWLERRRLNKEEINQEK